MGKFPLLMTNFTGNFSVERSLQMEIGRENLCLNMKYCSTFEPINRDQHVYQRIVLKTKGVKMNTKARRTYVAPTIDIFIIELENSIASGSAQVVIQSQHQDIEHGWESSIADDREIFW